MTAPSQSAAPLFAPVLPDHHRRLFLPRFLAEDAKAQASRDAGLSYEAAHDILIKWADLEAKRALNKKETALNANFLNDIFGNALGYAPIDQSTAGQFNLDREFHVPNVGPVDGALGHFPLSPQTPAPIAVIELKGSETDLDTHRANGRTAVNQLFDYLNALPNTKWGIVSNISTIRLYHKDRGSQAYEQFTLQHLRHADDFAAFWYLLEKNGLFASVLNRIPRADALLERTGARQKEVGDELYSYYADQRVRLVEHLQAPSLAKTFDQAVHIAQKLLNRIIFVAFCEDRGLLPQNIVKRTAQKPPVFRVTNPLWRQFLDLFFLVDKGHPGSEIEHGYNGGLFAHDPLVDDLQLDDSWTSVFTAIAAYDFQHEVNVDVLGHIFERSINEVQRARIAGLFGPTASTLDKPKMQKSAERKRGGIYYTPPEFTRFIVKEAVADRIAAHCAQIAQSFLSQNPAPSSDPLSPPVGTHPDNADPAVRIAYHSACIQAIRNFKIVDPACGSGAFLIAAYDALEDIYREHIQFLIAAGDGNAYALFAALQDWIVHENLHGVDLSEEAVEITRLALWIRSARPGKSLADLSRNIIWGNSIVDDPTLLPPNCTWTGWNAAFPSILTEGGGFDAVIGNPPWERLKLQEREFFDLHAPEIAAAVSAATRRKLVDRLESKNPVLHQKYLAARDSADKISAYARTSGRFPLTAKGDINTYMLFAELARSLVAPSGRVGLLVPSGIATDNTTKDFFADIIDSQALVKLYDFENRLGIFPDVDGRFKFCTLILGGSAVKTPAADFVFFAHAMDDLEEKKRHIPLSKKDIALFNPNTKTCPIFRTRKDVEITKSVYKRIPILVDESRKSGGNPWGVRFIRMFDQTNDAEKFISPETAKEAGFKFHQTHWSKGKATLLPLYEAKMAQAYDHRAASVVVEQDNWMRQGQTEQTSLVLHQNPEFVAVPRFWIDEVVVKQALPEQEFLWGFKDITSPTNQRTMIASAIPYCGVTNHFVLAQSESIPLLQLCLLANLNSFAYDYVVRQKIGGITLNFFIVEQLPTLPPDAYAEKCPWYKRQTLEQWISERVLKLTCTANDMIPLAKACNFNSKGDKPGGGIPYVWKWKDPERAELRAQLDAAYFHLYGLSHDDAAYILSTFQAAGSPDDPHSTTALILRYFDEYIP